MASAIEERLCSVRERISGACKRVHREPKDVGFILVTKQVDPFQIREAYRLGIRDFGENRVQEFTDKQDQLPKDIQWHFIGSLQTNKVKFLLGQVALIHSCDRLDLAEELEKQAAKQGQTVKLLIQVNTSGEKTKQGFNLLGIKENISKIVGLKRLNIRGLMTIGPNTQDQNKIRSAFRSLRTLRDQLQQEFPACDWRYLSMGMSADFELAIEEGANLLRLGTAVFGERPLK
ncbi:MAG: YggS family pyridoxal phosphate enzyme [Omnitrophica bacterium RIFCSPHIGHO2_02_FULL_46_11]|nr:MAG: YggS family pyridoxal phosphate enzyme [Omnitrophica bacterium RIFCSPHIGHO2_02_FULL_46_11]OGW85932.1 MAG: YggS family pyridoxal phosphate enzyme [Omnitrophica bacterium RIFCSPLOWO2_01_FULL_45_10b]